MEMNSLMPRRWSCSSASAMAAVVLWVRKLTRVPSTSKNMALIIELRPFGEKTRMLVSIVHDRKADFHMRFPRFCALVGKKA